MRFHQLQDELQNAVQPQFIQDSERLKQSQKFYAGESELLPDIHLSGKDFPRLPFPNIAIEFDMLCADGTRLASIDMVVEAAGSVKLVSFEKHENWAYRGTAVLNRWTGEVSYSGPSIIPDELVPITRQNLRSSVVMTGRFLQVLNCVNVTIETVEPARALNNKRSKAGRVPIYSYKILVLRGKRKEAVDGGGTHESPRVHLRRGHLKNRKTGQFWWQPCVVGDPKRGVVMKSYRADQLVESMHR